MAQQGNVTALPSGVEFHSGDAVVRITAVTDEIVRVRIGPGKLPEDASWAVLPAQRTSSVAVQQSGGHGFATKAVRVTIAQNPLQITISDLQGRVVSQDAPGRPVDLRADGGFTVWKKMADDEHFFGLGDKPGPLDRRDEAFTLWNTDAFGWQESTDPLYKAIPFYMGFVKGNAYGIFLDNTWRTSFDFGKADRNAMSFSADGGPLDYYVLAGPTPKDVLRQYAFLTGAPPLPPRWAFGYQQSRYSYTPDSQVRDIAAHLRADKIPADVLWLDIDYQDRNRPFTVDSITFPDMPKLVADMKAEGFHVVPITDLHIAYTPDDPTYQPWQTGSEQDAFVHNPDGSVFVGKVWPGPSVFPDFTREASRDWWGQQYKQFVGWGFAGFWNDMNEPSVFDGPGKTMPLDTVHRVDDPRMGFVTRTATHREMHNVFGMQQTRGTYDGLRTLAPDERPFVMTRASYAGGQRYAVTWTGDNSATWNHLRQTTPQMENLGLSGFAFVGADAGGFASSPQPDLLEKWLEISAFQPIDRDHSAKGTAPHEPWVNGPEREAVDRKFIELRYKLLPYIYTAAEETSRTGMPMLRPLFVDFPNGAKDGSPLDLNAGGEFLWGSDFLVAPAPFPDALDAYFLTLPPGGWYDFWTGHAMPNGTGLSAIQAEIEKSKDPHIMDRPDIKAAMEQAKLLKITPELDKLPVYVRAGAIVPMEPLTQNTMETPQGPLELRVYPPLASSTNCKGSVYWDDGHSFGYQRGEFSRQEFTCEAEQDALRLTLGKRDGAFVPWWKQIDVVVMGAGADARVTDGHDRPLTGRYDAATAALHVLVPADAAGGEVRVHGWMTQAR
jgi:alpha-glucosidase